MFGKDVKLFSWSKILGGMSKTLSIFNQIIPIYKEAKPMIQNARNAFNIVKEYSNKEVNKIINNKEKNIKPIKEKINIIKNDNQKSNNPTFFQ